MKQETKQFILLAAILILLVGCGQDELPPPPRATPPFRSFQPAVVEKKAEAPRYAYRGDRVRDPFIPLNGEGSVTVSSTEEVPVPQLGALVLKGVFDDGRQKMAMISGGGITYLLKGSRLYDNRQRPVHGFTGVIKKDSVLMIAPDRTTKELKLREK